MKKRRVQKKVEKYYSHSYRHEAFVPPIYMVGALYSLWGTNDSFSFTKKETLSINYVTVGAALFQQDGRRGVVESGMAFLAHEGASQSFETGECPVLHKRSILLRGRILEQFLTETGLAKTDVVRLSDPAYFEGMLRESYALMRTKPDGFIRRLSTLAYEILVELAKNIQLVVRSEVGKSVDFVKKSYGQPVTLFQIAQASGVSLRHCNRLFQKEYAVSPMQFLINHRMTIAQEMLVNTSLSIKQIAYNVGYADPLHFSHHFKKQVGVSPKGFREGRG